MKLFLVRTFFLALMLNLTVLKRYIMMYYSKYYWYFLYNLIISFLLYFTIRTFFQLLMLNLTVLKRYIMVYYSKYYRLFFLQFNYFIFSLFYSCNVNGCIVLMPGCVLGICSVDKGYIIRLQWIIGYIVTSVN